MISRAGPFRLTPDPGRTFHYHGFRIAADAIRRETLTGCPVILVAGAAGVGKTTLLHTIARSYEFTATKVIFLRGAQVGSGDLTRLLATAAGLTSPDLEQVSIADLRGLLSEHLEHRGAPQTSLLVIADDVDGLDPDAWEALLTLPTELSLTIPVTLIAACTPSFAELARRQALEDDALDSFQVTLESLSEEETQGYFQSMLEQLDTDSRPHLDPAAWSELHRSTEGLPRLINHVGGRLLMRWSSGSRQPIDLAELRLVIEDLRSEGILVPAKQEPDGHGSASTRASPPAAAAGTRRSWGSRSSGHILAVGVALAVLVAVAIVSTGLLPEREESADRATSQSAPPVMATPSAPLIGSTEPQTMASSAPKSSTVDASPTPVAPERVAETEPNASTEPADEVAASALAEPLPDDAVSVSAPADEAVTEPAAFAEAGPEDRPARSEAASRAAAATLASEQPPEDESLEAATATESLQAFEDGTDFAGVSGPEPGAAAVDPANSDSQPTLGEKTSPPQPTFAATERTSASAEVGTSVAMAPTEPQADAEEHESANATKESESPGRDSESESQQEPTELASRSEPTSETTRQALQSSDSPLTSAAASAPVEIANQDQGDPEVPAAADPHRAEILALLNDMEERLQRDQLTTPAGGSAWDSARSILAIDPSNPDARAGTDRIVQRYLVLARDALARGDHRLTGTLLDRAALVGGDFPAIADLRERLASAMSEPAPVSRIEVAILPSQTSINCPWPVDEYLTNVAKRIVEREPRLKLAYSPAQGSPLSPVVASSSTWWTPEGELRSSAPREMGQVQAVGAKVLVSSWIDCPRDEAVYEPWRRFKIALYDIEQAQIYANAGTLQDMEGPARALVDAFLDAQPDANTTMAGS